MPSDFESRLWWVERCFQRAQADARDAARRVTNILQKIKELPLLASGGTTPGCVGTTWTVNVVGCGSLALAGATVNAGALGTATTNAAGQAVFSIPNDGSYSATISKARFVSDTATVTISGCADANSSINLAPDNAGGYYCQTCYPDPLPATLYYSDTFFGLSSVAITHRGSAGSGIWAGIANSGNLMSTSTDCTAVTNNTVSLCIRLIDGGGFISCLAAYGLCVFSGLPTPNATWSIDAAGVCHATFPADGNTYSTTSGGCSVFCGSPLSIPANESCSATSYPGFSGATGTVTFTE